MGPTIRHPDWIRKFVGDAGSLAEKYSEAELTELARRAIDCRRGTTLMRAAMAVVFLGLMTLGASQLDRMLLEPGMTPFVFVNGIILLILLVCWTLFKTITLDPVYTCEEVAAAQRLKRIEARQRQMRPTESEQTKSNLN